MISIIFGEIQIESSLDGKLGDVNVTFYLDDMHIKTLTEHPFKFILDEKVMPFQKYKITVVATDNLGRESVDSIYARIINFGIL